MVKEYSGRTERSQGQEQQTGAGEQRCVLPTARAPELFLCQVAIIHQSGQNEVAFALTDSRSENLQSFLPKGNYS
jgi:hypothetical protein